MNNLGFRDHYISPADRAAVLVGRAFVAVCVSVVFFAASGRVRVAGFIFIGAAGGEAEEAEDEAAGVVAEVEARNDAGAAAGEAEAAFIASSAFKNSVPWSTMAKAAPSLNKQKPNMRRLLTPPSGES